ncbi:5'-methylthioadenosine/S-adenosylhomocysteine nucleosidase family protein [Acidaminobacter hydrogenoformans]|uniref:Nucleoside phosphorylase n=1 Tax=Acidaminobacter hydrogenoformans DSM 2784 TaxID=1120920 RepID=A0A1G5S6W2_9FIRM|nr:hypothetical protein [Acidaminobacter hydrogenoformans]SCZ81938.1 Nucleoside phosphorylase [Acidaminobacter hydrogenoformans DSM 2784]
MEARKKKITVQVGCRSEWHALEKALNPEAALMPQDLGPFSQYHIAELGGAQLIFFQGGPSKAVAAAACQHALTTYTPDLHIMMGTCGGVSGLAPHGGVLYAHQAAQYDCIDRLCESNDFFYAAFDVHIDNRWIREVLEARGLVGGTIATADQDIDYTVRKTLMAHGADVADWESAAAALVCHYNKVPILILRGVSDIPEESLSQEDQAESFLQTTPEIMGALAKLLPVIAEQLSKKTVLQNTRIPLYARPFHVFPIESC